MSTTTSPAPVTPPPRLGATAHVEQAERSPEPRWSIALRWLGDATSIVLLIAVLWWWAYHDGGWERTALARVGLLGVLAVPAAVSELRRTPILVRALLVMWAGGLVLSLLFAAERSGFAQPTTTYALVPVVGLCTYRLWTRWWGPPTVAGLLLVSFGLYWYQSFMDWWGLAMIEGRQPMWRSLSWHNQSGMLMATFGLIFAGAALTGRRLIALTLGVCAAGAYAGAWLSGSRGTMVVLVLGLVLLTATAMRARGVMTAALRLVALMTATIAVVASLTVFAEAQTGSDVTQPVVGRTESAEDNFFRRFLQMDAAIGMFVNRPMTGQGIGSYSHMSLPYMSPSSNLTVSAHNEYAEVLGEGGLPLAIPFVGLGLVAVAAGFRRFKVADHGLADLGDDIVPDDLRWPVSLGAVAASAAVLVHQGADFDWWYPVLPSLLAMAVAATGADLQTARPRTGVSRSGSLPVATGFLLAALLVAGSVGLLWESRANREQPDLSAEELARVPAAWDADRASDVAFDLMRAGHLEPASWTLERAVAWNPGYHPVRVDLAIVEYTAGSLSGRELVDVLLAGYLDFASTNEIAQALMDGGDHQLARSVLDSALELYPRYETWGIDGNRANTWYLLVRAAAEAGGCTAAREQAAEAHGSDGMDESEHLEPIDRLVETTCQ